MSDRSFTGPELTSGGNASHTVLHPRIPAFDAFVEGAAIENLAFKRVSWHTGDSFFMALEVRDYFLALDIDDLYGFVVTSCYEFGWVFIEIKGPDYFVMRFDLGHFILVIKVDEEETSSIISTSQELELIGETHGSQKNLPGIQLFGSFLWSHIVEHDLARVSTGHYRVLEHAHFPVLHDLALDFLMALWR